MAVIGVTEIKAPGLPADANRPSKWRDLTLKNVANNGVRFMFDLAFPYSYPGGLPATRAAAGAPSNLAVVQDMAEIANGDVAVPAGSIAYSGGGFDFTASSGLPSGVRVPAAALADIFTPFGGASQRFLLVGYFKMPAAVDWNNSASIETFMGDLAYSAAASLVNVNMRENGGTPGRIDMRRQIAAGTQAGALNLDLVAGSFGALCQIAVWRNAAGVGFRLKSAAQTSLITSAVGADNTQDFSASRMTWGRPNAFNNTTGVNTRFNGMRCYRGWLESLARSGRDPVMTLDNDWSYVQARITASAAANGGTSLIFV